MANQKTTGKRYAAITAIVIIALTVLLILFAFPDSSTVAETSGDTDRDREVSVTTYRPESVQSEIAITGRVKAVEQIDLFSEVQGVLTGGDRPFRTGVRFNEGEVLVRIDDTEVSLQLNSQRSRFLSTLTGLLSTIRLDYPDEYPAWQEWAESFNPETSLPDLPSMDNRQLRLFVTSRGLMDQYYSIKSAEFRLGKYEIRAPFDGELVGADLTPGNLVQPGVRLGTFTGDNMEVESFISQEDLDFVSVGDRVVLRSNALTDPIEGTINRIGTSVDTGTQAFPVYVQVSNAMINPGLYLEGTIDGQVYDEAVEIPRNLLSRSNSVMVVRNGVATYKSVEPLQFKRESVVVSGISEADSLINIRAGFESLAGKDVIIVADTGSDSASSDDSN